MNKIIRMLGAFAFLHSSFLNAGNAWSDYCINFREGLRQIDGEIADFSSRAEEKRWLGGREPLLHFGPSSDLQVNLREIIEKTVDGQSLASSQNLFSIFIADENKEPLFPNMQDPDQGPEYVEFLSQSELNYLNRKYDRFNSFVEIEIEALKVSWKDIECSTSSRLIDIEKIALLGIRSVPVEHEDLIYFYTDYHTGKLISFVQNGNLVWKADYSIDGKIISVFCHPGRVDGKCKRVLLGQSARFSR